MHYFIYATKDAWISSGSSHIDGTSYRDQNFGQDEILEIKKEFWNQSFDYQTRALISFAGTEFINVSQSIVAGDITNPKFYLRLYEAAGTQELSTEYKLAAFPLSQSWDEGIGKFGDNPKATNGVSWNNRNYYPGSSEVSWSSTAAVGDTFASGTLTISTGSYTNQEITIGSVDFIFVSGSTSVFDNNSSEIFVESGSSTAAVGDTFASGTLTISTGSYTNQEITIGGVDFIFVSGSTSVFDNNSSEIFVESGSSVDISANNLTGSINDNVATHGLSISASKGGTGIVILSGSSAGTVANLTAASSSTLFTFNGDESQALEGGTDSTSAVSGVDISANNLTGSINDNVATHGLSISASKGGTGIVILSGSSAGTVANLTAASSSALFTFNGDKSQALEGGTDSTSAVGGNGPSVVIGSTDASQSFSYESPDINMDVTDIVNYWLLSGSNEGFLLRFSGSQETNNSTFGQLKFFSSQTNTIYSPKLEVRWDDHKPCTGSNTGSLLPMTSSGAVDNILYMRGLRESYKETDKVKFRVMPRKRYIQKDFSTSVQTLTGSFIPEGRGSYSFVDMATGETIIPFSAYTSMSCDSTSNYFIQWLNGFYPNRAYKILYKIKYDDSQEIICDNNFEFIIRS